jgi:hypothetical protein
VRTEVICQALVPVLHYSLKIWLLQVLALHKSFQKKWYWFYSTEGYFGLNKNGIDFF